MQNLQDTFLEKWKEDGSLLRAYLRNGIGLEGVIESFDDSVIILDGMLVYKHALSTIAIKGNKVYKLSQNYNRVGTA